MKHEGKAVEALRRTNPVRDDEVPGADSPKAQELLARIIATPRDHGKPAPPSRRRLQLVIAVAVISIVTVAATLIWLRTISIPNAIICYQDVDLDSDTAGAPAGETAAAEACVPVWEQRTLVNPDISPPGSVPPLTACVARNGALAVLPTEDTSICRRLGLAQPDPATQPSADNIRTLEGQLIDYFQSVECVAISEAIDHVRAQAEDHGLGSWAIEAQGETPERPCASFSIDPELETILIVPIPPP
jgi:hypothetical protein